MPTDTQYGSETMEQRSPVTLQQGIWIEETYPLIDESFREDWEAPRMEDYDRYEDFTRT